MIINQPAPDPNEGMWPKIECAHYRLLAQEDWVLGQDVLYSIDYMNKNVNGAWISGYRRWYDNAMFSEAYKDMFFRIYFYGR